MVRKVRMDISNYLAITSICLSLCWPFDLYANNSGLSAAGISPTRIVVPANQRSASVTLTNTSNVEIAYRMQLIEMGLDESGNFGELETEQLPEAQRSVRSIIRFSPRQVRLKPGASQVVRAIVRRNSITESGEFRSHLRLQALPILSTSDLTNASTGDAVLVQSAAGIDIGVTIPVIVRHGETDADVSLNNVKVNFDESGKAKKAELLLELSGTRSTFGDFSISLVNGKKVTKLGKLRSFALYYPYPREWVNIPFSSPLDRDQIGPNSRIRVQFENKAEDSVRDYWIDETIAPLTN